MPYTVNFIDVEKILSSKLVDSSGNYFFNEVMASIINGFVGLSVVNNSFNSVTLQINAGSIVTRVTTEGFGLAATPLGAGFGIQSGTVTKISYSIDLGSGFFDVMEITDLNLSGLSVVNTIRDFSIGSLRGNQVILANEGIRYFATDANDIFLANTKGVLGETLTLNGDDYLKLAGGNDRFVGQDGNDTMFGELGNDTLFGDKGNDSLNGGAGKDVLRGGTGNDAISGGSANDYLYGDSGRDKLLAGNGADRVYGGASNDILIGGNGNDFLDGGRQNDRLIGGGGNDYLRGSGGDDVLIGGAGRDLLVGGTGNDVFLFRDGSGKDTIRAYQIGSDQLKIVTEHEISTKVTSNGVRVTWDSNSILVENITDVADLDFI